MNRVCHIVPSNWKPVFMKIYNYLATLPFHEMPAIVSELRQKEMEQRKMTYQWGWVSDVCPEMSRLKHIAIFHVMFSLLTRKPVISNFA